MTSASAPENSRPASVLVGFLCLAILFVSGCAANRLRVDYKGYENAYAESSNRQMLLNLARLNQHHPTFFFKMGQISTNYRMQATLTGNGTFSPQGNPNGVTGGGVPGVLYEKDPSFTFIPVNDDKMAEQLLKPVPPEFFIILFQQGWRVDQLLRLMVDHIEFQTPGVPGVQIIRNVPSADNADQYLTFLRICALAFQLQRRGHLVLTGGTHFVPLIKGLKDPPAAKDMADEFAKNIIWKHDEDQKELWDMGQEVTVPVIQLNPPGDADNSIREQIGKEMPDLKGVKSLDPVLSFLTSGYGFGVQQDPSEKPDPNAAKKGSAKLIMRSLIGIMAAAAQEETTFDELMAKRDPSQAPIPKVEMQPILSLKWKDKPRLTPALVQLEYFGETYKVADKWSDDPLEASSWNRDVFRIITQLAAQVTVDISKFPLPEILQLRTQ